MNGNEEFLNYIYQNSEMGIDTIKQLSGIVKDESYKQLLNSQMSEYRMIFEESRKKLKDYDTDIKGINRLSKLSTYLMINFNTITDKSPSHISEMLIQGSTMGIVDITKKINQYKDADPGIVSLANRLLELERNNVEECKKYLH